MNNVLLWIGGLLVALLCALFAVPHFVDWTRYRGVFEEEASRVLGRDLRVAGAVNLRLLPTPYVRFEKIRLSDAAGQTGEPFFRADDFTLWLAPGPLLRGAIEAREVELRKPTLKLRLNAEGGGNWQTLSIAKGSLPFVPSDVALQSVQITDGTISVDDADGRELVRSGGISGELSVTALEGPYRFKGSFDWAGARQEIKLASTAFDAEGNLRLKVQSGVPVGGGTLSFDGRLADISKRIKLEGQISGQVGFDPAGIGRGAVEAPAAGAKPKRLPVEVRGAVAANADGASFTDVNFAFEHEDKPQLVAATVEVLWRGGLATRAAVTSRWLDLDRLLGDKGGRPLDGMRRLSSALGHLLPASGSARATIDIDQVTLGGEALSDLHFDVERDGSAVRLAGLRLNLPGGTRASLSGLLPTPESLDGEVSLRGANFARFLGWLGYPATGDSRAEGIFSLKSRLAFDQQSVSVKDAMAGLGNALLSGGIAYKWVDRPRLDVVLDGDQIDLGLFSPHALDLIALRRQLGGLEEANAAAGTPLSIKLDPKAQDTTLRIRAGRLVDADRDLRDVELDASLIDSRVAIKRMRFATGAGLEVEAEGALADVGTQPRGEFRGTLAVADAASIGELAEIFEQPTDGELARRLRPLAPARVAWVTRLSGPKTNPTPVIELTLDGQVLGRRMTATGRFDGRMSDWRQGQVALNVAIDRPDWLRLKQIVEGEGAVAAAKAVAGTPAAGKSRLQIKTSGRPLDQLATYVKLEDDAFDAGWSGRVTFGTDALKSVDGELQIRTADLAQAWAALGLPPRNLPGIAVDGAADVAFKDQVYRITPSALEMAGAVVGGEMTVAAGRGPGRRRLDGKLAVSRIAIPRLLDLIVDGRTQAAAGGSVDLWQSAAFDFSLFDRIDGSVRIEAGEMSLTPDLVLQKGLLDAEISGARLTIKALDGDMLGTRLSSRWAIEKAAAGATLSGSGKVDGIKLALLPRAQGRIDGTAAASFNVSGRGLSPRGLISAMTGKGELQLAKAWTGGLSIQAVRRLAEETIVGKREPTVEAVEKAVAAMLTGPARDERMTLGDRRIAFEVGDGAVKLEPFRVEAPDGRAANRTTIDLARLAIDSEWKLDAVAPKPVVLPGAPEPKTASTLLPPVAIAFVGPLASVGKLEPVVSVDSLVRELAVRRMEHDVAELERLRRLDEERAKAEAERRKAEEAARQAAAAAAAAAAAIPAIEPPAAPSGQPAPPTVVAPMVIEPATAAAPATEPPVPAGGDPAQAPAAAPAAPVPPKRTVGSEQRQVPSSQELKKARVQDVFKRQESGGN